MIKVHLLFCIIIFLFYTSRENFTTVDLNGNLTKDQLLIKITDLQEQLFNCKLSNQQCQSDLQIKSQQQLNSGGSVSNVNDKFLEKVYNPLSGTSPMNPQGSFSNPRGYDGFKKFQQLGYISGPNGRYPIMGRYKFSGKTDKFEYYSIDNERGRIKIPFKNKNDNELYDGDSIQIPELGGEFTFKKYEDTDGFRYDPNLIQ